MPRYKKTDKFYWVKTTGIYRTFGNIQVGVNTSYDGDLTNLTLQEFVDFLHEQGIDPANVRLSGNFTTFGNK